MDWQLPTALGLVVLAVAYVIRSAWRTWAGPTGARGCGSGCGTCASPAGTADTTAPGDDGRISLPQV